MDIIHQLGVNHTYFFQFGIFLITVTALSFVFRDFSSLLERRALATRGSEDLAGDIGKQLLDLNAKYETKARQLNSEIQKVYSEYRAEATADQEKLISASRQKANILIEQTRTKVAHEVTESTRRLTDEIPLVAQAISQKLLTRSGSNK